MRDAAGRALTYLRVSLTDHCNFRCAYCMPRGLVDKLPRDRVLRFEEILDIVRVMADRAGITKVRVTGGEPLLRRGVLGFLRELARVDGLRDVSLTTNGYLLGARAAEVREAGIRRINVSLDSLRRERFRRITGVDGLDRVLAGIRAARAAGFSPLKLNVVALRDTLDEVFDFLDLAAEVDAEVRFIELMPFSGLPGFVSGDEIRTRLETRHRLVPLRDPGGGGEPATRYRLDGGTRVVGLITPVSRPFCAQCNRLRLQSDGVLIPCLKGPARYDLMPFIRPRLREAALATWLEETLRLERKEGRFDASLPPMIRLGG